MIVIGSAAATYRNGVRAHIDIRHFIFRKSRSLNPICILARAAINFLQMKRLQESGLHRTLEWIPLLVTKFMLLPLVSPMRPLLPPKQTLPRQTSNGTKNLYNLKDAAIIAIIREDLSIFKLLTDSQSWCATSATDNADCDRHCCRRDLNQT